MHTRTKLVHSVLFSPEELAQHLSRAQEELTIAQQKIALLERELAARRQSEEVLGVNTAKLRLVLKQLPVMIWTADTSLRITSWAGSGPIGEQLEHYQIVGQTLPMFFGTDDVNFPPLEAALRANDGRVSDGTFSWNDRLFLMGSEPIWGRDGSPVGQVAIAIDLAAPRLQAAQAATGRTLEQEIEARKVTAVSRLAGGLAHELNNVLTGIVGYADLLRLRTPANDPSVEAIETIQQGAARATGLTQQLLGYSRGGKNQSVPVDLTALLREAASALAGNTGTGTGRIAINVDLAQAVTIEGDPRQWRDVFHHLLQNAREALPTGGTVTVASSIVVFNQPLSQLDGDLPPGRYYRLTVHDSGAGIPAEQLPRVFEPFFSAGRGEKNLGLGLSFAYGVVRNHGGGIVVESSAGNGTSVQILFPAPAAVDLSPKPRQAHIVVIDDEAYVRQALERMLDGLGYRVSSFEECQQGIDYYRLHQQEVDLVIMDLVMPKSSGKACFAALKTINPGVKAILASGFGQDGAVQEALDLGMRSFLQKPFQLQTLGQAVAGALKA